MREVRLGALLVVLDRADVAAVGHADDDGHRHRAVVAHRLAGELRGDLVERREDEAVELDLDDGPVAAHREADRRADDAGLGERGVEHALVAELGLQALGHAEHAAERADVLAHEQHLVVGAQRLAEAGVDRLRHRERVHAAHARIGMCAVGGRVGGRCARRGPTRPRRLDRHVGHAVLLLGACAHAAPPSNPDSNASSHADSSAMSGCGSLYTWAKIFSRGGAGNVEGPTTHVGRDIRRLVVDLVEERRRRAAALEPRAVAGDRVALGPVLDLGVGAVLRGVVGGGVRAHAVGERLDEAGAVAGSRLLERLPRDGVADEHVVAVDAHAGHAESAAAQRERAARLARDRDRDRPLVVLHEEHLRRLVARREDEGLVGVALRRGAVAVVHEHRGIRVGIAGADAAVELDAHGVPGGVQGLRGEHQRVEVEVAVLRGVPAAERRAAQQREDRRRGRGRGSCRRCARGTTGRCGPGRARRGPSRPGRPPARGSAPTARAGPAAAGWRTARSSAARSPCRGRTARASSREAPRRGAGTPPPRASDATLPRGSGAGPSAR